MRSVIFILIISILIITMNSCSPGVKISNKKSDYRLFNEYLLKVFGDTNMYEVLSLKIIDENIYPILDSAIISTERCEYFDNRIPYLHAFRISVIEEKGRFVYSIYTHESIKDALGLLINRDLNDINKPMHVGIFYYKNYLFAAPLGSHLINFPFCALSGCQYRIFAPDLYDQRKYSSYIDFVKQEDKYVIIENGICGEQILIR